MRLAATPKSYCRWLTKQRAPPDSLRGTLFSSWESLGLAAAPNTTGGRREPLVEEGSKDELLGLVGCDVSDVVVVDASWGT